VGILDVPVTRHLMEARREGLRMSPASFGAKNEPALYDAFLFVWALVASLAITTFLAQLNPLHVLLHALAYVPCQKCILASIFLFLFFFGPLPP
jgi:hypothetical protein